MLNGAEKTWAGAGIGERSHLERFAMSRAAPHGQAQLFCPLDPGYGRRMDFAPPLLAVPDHTELTCNG